jgi:hypothetical protein
MNVKWGKYSDYEGPYCFGNIKYVIPEKSNLDEKSLAVVAATEGNFDGVNMYDRCIISVGIIQWCEAQYFGVTNLLSDFCKQFGVEKINFHLKEINEFLGYDCWKNIEKNKFSFTNKDGSAVKNINEQQALFLGCSGKIGSWNSENKKRAELWVKTFVNILRIPEMTEFQKQYTIAKLKSIFLNKDVAKILFPNSLRPEESTPIIDAAYLAYISFSANNPKFARNNFLNANLKNKDNFKTRGWLLAILKEMTFANKIKIYEDRYDKIIKVINSFFPHLNLPKNSLELSKEVV